MSDSTPSAAGSSAPGDPGAPSVPGTPGASCPPVPSRWPCALRYRADVLESGFFAGLAPPARTQIATVLRELAELLERAWEVAPDTFEAGVQSDPRAWPWRNLRAIVLRLAEVEWLAAVGVEAGTAEQQRDLVERFEAVLEDAMAEFRVRVARRSSRPPP